uniref:Histone_H2A_C domain-containing protein n=1 Tax=Heterorhabditis bacteriophora TaxID=37862 RepID=A0A1I7WHU8_HETBA
MLVSSSFQSDVLVALKPSLLPRHLQLAVRNDEELNKLLSGVIIA